jgi:hypothetical protein
MAEFGVRWVHWEEFCMNTIRILKKLESETFHLPELHALIGKDVEIVVTEVPSMRRVTPGTGDWDAAMQAARELEDCDCDAVRAQRECDLFHADDHLP